MLWEFFFSILLLKKKKLLKIIDTSHEKSLQRFLCEKKVCSKLLKIFCMNVRWIKIFISNYKLATIFAVFFMEWKYSVNLTRKKNDAQVIIWTPCSHCQMDRTRKDLNVPRWVHLKIIDLIYIFRLNKISLHVIIFKFSYAIVENIW